MGLTTMLLAGAVLYGVLLCLSVYQLLSDVPCTPRTRCYRPIRDLTAEDGSADLRLELWASDSPEAYWAAPERADSTVGRLGLPRLLEDHERGTFRLVESLPLALPLTYSAWDELRRVLQLNATSAAERVVTIPVAEAFPSVRRNGTLTARVVLSAGPSAAALSRHLEVLASSDARHDVDASLAALQRSLLGAADVRLTSFRSVQRELRSLWGAEEPPGAAGGAVPGGAGGAGGAAPVAHFKFVRGRVQLQARVVADGAAHGARVLPDGTRLQTFGGFSLPIVYVDETERVSWSALPLSGDPAHPDPQVSLRLAAESLGRFRVSRQVHLALRSAAAVLHEAELDELRYFMSEKRLFRFLLTQCIGLLHVWLEFLAFRNDVGFYAARSSFEGLSVSSAAMNAACSTVVFLFLADAQGTSLLLLLSILMGVAVDWWKVLRMLRFSWGGLLRRLRGLETPEGAEAAVGEVEERTRRYDRIAFRTLSLALAPAVAGVALRSLVLERHYGYYSWAVSSLASGVYWLGFAKMCPQLYINYRLQTVSYMPIRVFMYKAFQTVVDDVAAYLLDMPFQHKIATLRDDVVFLCLIAQYFLYRVDKTRPNCYGRAYERADGEGEGEAAAAVQAEGEEGAAEGEEGAAEAADAGS